MTHFRLMSLLVTLKVRELWPVRNAAMLSMSLLGWNVSLSTMRICSVDLMSLQTREFASTAHATTKAFCEPFNLKRPKSFWFVDKPILELQRSITHLTRPDLRTLHPNLTNSDISAINHQLLTKSIFHNKAIRTSMASPMTVALKSRSITASSTVSSKIKFKLLISSWRLNLIKIGRKSRKTLKMPQIKIVLI